MSFVQDIFQLISIWSNQCAFALWWLATLLQRDMWSHGFTSPRRRQSWPSGFQMQSWGPLHSATSSWKWSGPVAWFLLSTVQGRSYRHDEDTTTRRNFSLSQAPLSNFVVCHVSLCLVFSRRWVPQDYTSEAQWHHLPTSRSVSDWAFQHCVP